MSDVHEQVMAVMGRVLNVDPGAGPLVRGDTSQWDSLKHVDLIFALEDEFDVQFSEQEMNDATSSSAIANMIEAHRAS
jgi:acyl carrier protein